MIAGLNLGQGPSWREILADRDCLHKSPGNRVNSTRHRCLVWSKTPPPKDFQLAPIPRDILDIASILTKPSILYRIEWCSIHNHYAMDNFFLKGGGELFVLSPKFVILDTPDLMWRTVLLKGDKIVTRPSPYDQFPTCIIWLYDMTSSKFQNDTKNKEFDEAWFFCLKKYSQNMSCMGEHGWQTSELFVLSPKFKILHTPGLMWRTVLLKEYEIVIGPSPSDQSLQSLTGIIRLYDMTNGKFPKWHTKQWIWWGMVFWSDETESKCNMYGWAWLTQNWDIRCKIGFNKLEPMSSWSELYRESERLDWIVSRIGTKVGSNQIVNWIANRKTFKSRAKVKCSAR